MNKESTIALYRKLFIHRGDTFALQRPNGRYYRVPLPVTNLLVDAHLRGHVTAGWYALLDQTCRWLCYDADSSQGWDNLHLLRQVLARDGIPAHLERSRRGGHLWLFLAQPMPATACRRVALQYLDKLKLGDVTLYPRSSSARYGSLVRGPLGTHRLSGEHYAFAAGGTVAEQLATLWEGRVEPEIVRRLDQPLQVKNIRHTPRVSARLAPQGSSPINRLNQVLDVWELASQVTELDPRTGMGSCPFHPPDRHPSFGVHAGKQFWICWHGTAGDGRRPMGGDAFELYCRLHRVSHREGIAQLAYLL